MDKRNQIALKLTFHYGLYRARGESESKATRN
jgi:hypothetical protein